MKKLEVKKETVTTLDDEILAQVYGGIFIDGTADTAGC
jgi:hypothetical protein